LGFAIGGRKIDLRTAGAGSLVQVRELSHQFAGFADAGFRLASARLRSAAKPLDLSVDKIFERFLTLRLRVQEFFFLLQKVNVAPVNTERTIGINTAEFDHVSRDILQKVAVVTHDDARKSCTL